MKPRRVDNLQQYNSPNTDPLFKDRTNNNYLQVPEFSLSYENEAASFLQKVSRFSIMPNKQDIVELFPQKILLFTNNLSQHNTLSLGQPNADSLKASRVTDDTLLPRNTTETKIVTTYQLTLSKGSNYDPEKWTVTNFDNEDPELEQYAQQIRTKLSETGQQKALPKK